jgi:hypothetical protein
MPDVTRILVSTIAKERPTVYLAKGDAEEIRRLAVTENFWVNIYSLTAAVGQGSPLGTILKHEYFNAPRDSFNMLIRHAVYELGGLSPEQRKELVAKAYETLKLALEDRYVVPIQESDLATPE